VDEDIVGISTLSGVLMPPPLERVGRMVLEEETLAILSFGG